MKRYHRSLHVEQCVLCTGRSAFAQFTFQHKFFGREYKNLSPVNPPFNRQNSLHHYNQILGWKYYDVTVFVYFYWDAVQGSTSHTQTYSPNNIFLMFYMLCAISLLCALCQNSLHSVSLVCMIKLFFSLLYSCAFCFLYFELREPKGKQRTFLLHVSVCRYSCGWLDKRWTESHQKITKTF